MAKPERSRRQYFRILNIKLRRKSDNKDQSSEDYIRLFKSVVRKKIHSESSPSKHCIFRFMFEEKDKKRIILLSGTFAQFTFIHNEKWFNLDSLDLDEEFKIPKGLFPDAKITDFVFVPSAHRFCYKINSQFNASPYSIKKFLETALNEAAQSNEYVQVDVESEKATLKKILAAKEIRKLLIDINYSNVDVGDDLQKFVEDDIKASNTSRLKIEATHKPANSIDINSSKILQGAIESSISNGETEATIIDQNDKLQKIKTTNYPRKEGVFGTPSMFKDLVYDKIMRIFRPNDNKAN